MRIDGEYLGELMRYLGLSMYRLSELSGVSRGTILNWISGNTEPRRGNLWKIVPHLGLDSPDQLAPGATNRPPTSDPVARSAIANGLSREAIRIGLEFGWIVEENGAVRASAGLMDSLADQHEGWLADSENPFSSQEQFEETIVRSILEAKDPRERPITQEDLGLIVESVNLCWAPQLFAIAADAGVLEIEGVELSFSDSWMDELTSLIRTVARTEPERLADFREFCAKACAQLAHASCLAYAPDKVRFSAVIGRVVFMIIEDRGALEWLSRYTDLD
jgi:transcriptional regulator with XRE-family HTH domain